MKKLSFLFLLTMIGLSGSSQNFKVLFIGNSYTGSNNLPQTVYDLAASGGDTMSFSSNTPGGYTFQAHSTNNTTKNLIKQTQWDFVVLQEQSQLPSFPDWQVQQDVFPYAAILNDSIESNNPCTETVFYMTWGRKYGDQMNCPGVPYLCTFLGMQNALRKNYLQMGDDNLATVAPVGIAWKNSMTADSSINLYVSDNSHPSVHGTYLTACVFYTTLWQKSPVGLSYTGSLTSAEATFLQNIAYSTVMDSLDTWNINGNVAQAGFSFTDTNTTVTFTNTSSQAQQYWWDFGDQTVDSTANPTHQYASAGTYVVTLIASNGCSSDTIIDTITVSTGVGISESLSGQNGFTIYPNPFAGQLNVISQSFASHEEVELHITDALGRTLERTTISGAKLQQGFTLAAHEWGSSWVLIHLTGTHHHYSQVAIPLNSGRK